MKKITNALASAMAIVMFALVSLGAAADQDPFKQGTDLAKSITGSLTGDIAAAVLTLIIVIFGYACWIGKVSREWALKIIGGSAIVACAGGLAALIFGS